MDIIESRLYQFCDTNNFHECISILHSKLKKTPQVNDYDEIYTAYMEKLGSPENQSLDIVVDGLNKIVSLIVFSHIYSFLLFPDKCEPYDLKEDTLNWLISLFDSEYTIRRFIEIAFQFSSMRDCIFEVNKDNKSKTHHKDEHVKKYGLDVTEKYIFTMLKYNDLFFSLDNEIGSPVIDRYIEPFELPKNRFCFPYILLGKSCKLKIDSMADLLVGNRLFTRAPIGLLLYDDKDTPHGGGSSLPHDFLSHDFFHFKELLLDTVKHCDFEKLYEFIDICNPDKKSFERHLLDLFIHIVLFEVGVNVQRKYHFFTYQSKIDGFSKRIEITDCANINIVDYFEDVISDIPNLIDLLDIEYMIKHLVNSTNAPQFFIDAWNDTNQKIEVYKKTSRKPPASLFLNFLKKVFPPRKRYYGRTL